MFRFSEWRWKYLKSFWNSSWVNRLQQKQSRIKTNKYISKVTYTLCHEIKNILNFVGLNMNESRNSRVSSVFCHWRNVSDSDWWLGILQYHRHNPIWKHFSFVALLLEFTDPKHLIPRVKQFLNKRALLEFLQLLRCRAVSSLVVSTNKWRLNTFCWICFVLSFNTFQIFI